MRDDKKKIDSPASERILSQQLEDGPHASQQAPPEVWQPTHHCESRGCIWDSGKIQIWRKQGGHLLHRNAAATRSSHAGPLQHEHDGFRNGVRQNSKQG